jgi:ketosteroid isomerase-like protein
MDQVSLMRGLYDAYLAGDLEGALAGFHPDIQLKTIGRRDDHPAFGERRGHQGFRDFVQALGASHRMDSFVIDDICGAGDKVFVTGRYAMTFLGSGKSAASDFVHVWTVRDGQAVDYKEFLDTASIVDAYRG